MKDPYLLHVFSPTKYVSPFDINMAYEANYDAVIPYCNVTLDEIHPLTQASADLCNARYGLAIKGAGGGAPGAVAAMLEATDVVFNAAKAGIRMVDTAMLSKARHLKVAADANAVPPSGIEGVGAKDHGVELKVATGIARGLGALAVGDVKYRVHTGLLSMMHNADKPLYLAHDEAFALARGIVG